MAEELKEKATATKRFIWLLIIILLLLILAAAIYLLLTYFKPASTNQVKVTGNVNTVVPPTVPPAAGSFNKPDSGVLADLQGMNPNQENITPAQQTNLLFAASSFAERFGTYSNQSNYKNFDELKVFMTDSVAKWVTATYIPQLKKQNPDLNTYYAIETKAISSQIRKMDQTAGKAEVMIKTQRQEFNKTITNPRVYYQDILLQLVMVDNQWKVDGVYWQ